MDTNEQFWVLFSVSLLLAFTVERIVNAVVTSLFFLVTPRMGLHRYASLSVLKESVSGVLDGAQSLIPLVSGIFSRWWTILFAFIVVLLAFAIQSESSFLLSKLMGVYNDPLSIFLRDSFKQSLKITKLFVDPFVLLWNFFVVIGKKIFTDVMLPVLKHMDTDLLNIGQSLFNTAKYLLVSIISYVNRLKGQCDPHEGLQAVYNVTTREDVVLCFVPGRRNFDLINPMAELRVFVAYMLVISRRVCGLLSVPLDAITLPFLDSNFALFVHNFVNSFLYWFVGMPITTIERCNLGKEGGLEDWKGLLFCLPDVAPGFNYMVASIRYLGRLVDNFLNLTWNLILNSLGLQTSECKPEPLSLEKPNYDASFFGGNYTRVVGLSSHSYALTDGWSILWSDFVGQPVNTFSPYAWGLESTIDLSLGLAAVKYSVSNDESVGVSATGSASDDIMGCRCDDHLMENGDTRMQIRCAIARYEPGNTEPDGDIRSSVRPHYFNVSFFRSSTATFYKCSETKITVDSARYPLWRLGQYDDTRRGQAFNLYDPLNPRAHEDGSDRNTGIDAVVWVQPACDARGITDLRCVRSLADAGDCFPACLAVRKVGSTDGELLLRNMDDWEEGVQILNQDCSGNAFSDPGNVISYETDGRPRDEYNGETHSSLDENGGRYYFRHGYDITANECRYSPHSDTFVKNSSLIKGSDVQYYDPILLETQPFATSGEVALVEAEDSDGRPLIVVKRLFGQQGTGFVSLVTLPNKLEALESCDTLKNCNEEEAFTKRRVKATIPYSIMPDDPQQHNIAVTTRYSVIYAVNPSFESYRAFYKYCNDDDSYDMQIVVNSGVGRVRLFRVDAFTPQGPPQATGTFRGFVEGGFTESLDTKSCSASFYLGVEAMEVIDDYNVAVTIAFGNPYYYDPTRKNDYNLKVEYRVLYLNPETMMTRELDLWHAEDGTEALALGILCPSQRIFPEFGSAVAEMVSAVVLTVKVVLEIIITSPATFRPGAYLGLDIPVGRSFGHSMLMSNSGWFDVDSIFNALSRAQFLFWNSFSKLGGIFTSEPYVNQFLNGLSLRYQSYTPLVLSSMKSYLGSAERATKVLDTTMSNMLQRVAGKIPIVYSGMTGSAGMINMAHFAVRIFKTWMLQIVMPALDTGSSEDIVHSLWQVVADGFGDYEELILNSELRSCTGLQLMLGYNSPPAKLANSICTGAVHFKMGAIQVLLTFFVDVPILDCVCKADQGLDWRKRLTDQCASVAPSSYRSDMRELIQELSLVETVCERISVRVQRKFSTAMDRFLETSYETIRIAGGCIDYFRIFWDDEAGSCNDFAEDSSLTTIIPDPPDFWRACTQTTTCRRKCLSSIESFESFRAERGQGTSLVTKKYQSTVESKYFSEYDILSGNSRPPFEIQMLKEIKNCMLTCGVSNSGDRCVAIAGIDNNRYTVAEYCVPRRVDAFVYEKTRWSVQGSESWSLDPKILDVSLGYQDVGNLCPQNDGAFCSLVVLFMDRVSTYRRDGIEFQIVRFDDPEYLGMKPESLTVLGNELILVTGFYFDSGRKDISLCIDTRVDVVESFGKFAVRRCDDQNIFNRKEEKLSVCSYGTPETTVCDNIIQIPLRSDDASIVKLPFEESQSGKLSTQGSRYELASNAIKAAGLYQFSLIRLIGGGSILEKITRSRDVVVSTTRSDFANNNINIMEIFVANHPKRKRYGWLSVMKIDTTLGGSTVANSFDVSIDVEEQITCSVRDCRGCTDYAVQTMCYAAQQCTLVRCMGTAVSLDRFLCAGGKLFISDTMESFLQQWQAVWNILVGFVVESVALSTTREPSSENVRRLSDAFMNNVCFMKDVIYDAAAFFVSMINTNINQISGLVALSETQQSIFYTGNTVTSMTDRIEEQRAHAQRVLQMAAVTRLIGNVGLGALYPLLISNKVLTCQTQDLLAIINTEEFTLEIFDPSMVARSDALVGTCLSNYELQNDESISQETTRIDAIVTDTIAFFGGLKYTPVKHFWDGVLTYFMSIVRGFQDVMAVATPKYCRLPDASPERLSECACGDDAVEVPERRAKEGLAQHAFWCTGMLQLASPFGEQMYVYNPYSYAELLDWCERNNMDGYLSCIGNPPEEGCEEPNDSFFEDQGVSILSVLSRCKLNYMSKQWDPGSAHLYQLEFGISYMHSSKMSNKAGVRAQEDFETYLKNQPGSSIFRCMERAASERTSNDACLEEKMRDMTQDRSGFFSYHQPETFGSPLRIAACEVYTGPLDHVDGENVFQGCKSPTSSSDQDTCDLPPFLWSSRSRGNVPVANEHAIGYANKGTRIDQAIAEIEDVKSKLLEAVEYAEKWWDPDVLELSLFTAEGDTLHQAADCFMMGPFGASELFPTDVDRRIPTSIWSRDASGSTREFDLPCTGEKLNGQTTPPFTCGSPARRKILREFVERFLDSTTDTQALKAVINTMVKAIFSQAKRVFHQSNALACECNNGLESYDCCGAENRELFLKTFRQMSESERNDVVQRFLPSTLREFQFTYINASTLAEGTVEKLYDFLDTEVWKRSWGGMGPLTDAEREIAKDEAYLRTTGPLFDYEEVMERENVTALQLCVGSLSQTMFPVPVRAENGEPTTLRFAPKWDPITLEGDEYFTSLERWLQTLMSDAKRKSPLHWSHQLKQVPSFSSVCSEIKNETLPTDLDNDVAYFEALRSNCTYDFTMESIVANALAESVTILPPMVGEEKVVEMLMLRDSMRWTLGNLTSSCFCGWRSALDDLGRRWCEIPDVVCGQAVQGTTMHQVCNLRRGMYWHHGENSAVGQSAQDFDLQPEECPWNRVDPAAWGLVQEQMMEQYLQGSATSETLKYESKDLLYYGRGGFRFMNAIDLIERGRDSPLTKYFNLQDAAASIVQTHCETSSLQSFDLNGWKHRFYNEFFPTVQPVRENRMLSYCLRYATEQAFLTALNTIYDSSNHVVLQQEEFVRSFYRKCLTQVKIAGFCHVNGVFDSIRTSAEYNHDEACSLFSEVTDIPDTATTSVYVVSENCLTLVNEGCLGCVTTVYDPCGSNLCTPGEPISLNAVKSESEIIDVSALLNLRGRSASLRWSDVSDPHWSDIMEERLKVGDESYRSELGLHIDVLWKKYVLDTEVNSRLPNFGDTDAFWGTKEGKREDDLRAFCGGASDWFPRDWEHPVGYHVSTKCRGTAWRTFANHFIFDKNSGNMQYAHSAQRTKVGTHAGSSGICRLNSYNTPVREQQNVRFCTRMPQGQRVDYSVPVLEQEDQDAVFSGFESCSSGPYDVPWDPEARTETRFTTSGLLTSWPLEDGLWPSHDGFRPLGLANHSGPHEWSTADGDCGMPPLFVCRVDDDCTRNILDTALLESLSMQCLGGVCHVVSSSEDPAIFAECTAHSDCDENLLCSGEGRCVMPIIELANEGGEDIEFSMYSEECDENITEKVDMRGKSPWGRIHSLLRAYGMCSYRAWYEYRTMLERCESGDSPCTLSQDDSWVDTLSDIPKPIYQTGMDGLLFQEAHECDRKYAYMQNTHLCKPTYRPTRPRNYFLVQNDREKIDPDNVRYSALYETYRRDNNKLRLQLKKTRGFQNKNSGFIDEVRTWKQLNPIPCRDVTQCSLPPYPLRGKQVPTRMVCLDPQECREYSLHDAIRCGSFGFQQDPSDTETLCILDKFVVPMYHLLCDSELPAHCAEGFDAGTCDTLKGGEASSYTYAQGEERVQRQQLLNSIIQDVWDGAFSTLQQYEDKSICAHYVYEWLEETENSKGRSYTVDDNIVNSLNTLYYFTKYSMYEVPPAFWVKCVYLSQEKLSSTSGTNCHAWTLNSAGTGASGEGLSMTVKEWLIKRVPKLDIGSFNSFLFVPDAIKKEVKQQFLQSLQDVKDSFSSFQCYSDKRWIHYFPENTCNSDDVEKLKFLEYRSLSPIFSGEIYSAPNLQPACCQRQGCVRSTNGAGNPSRSTTLESEDKNLIQDLIHIFNSSVDEVEYIRENENVLNEMIREEGGTIRIPYYDQPWLESEVIFEDLKSSIKKKLIEEYSWNRIQNDQCILNPIHVDHDVYKDELGVDGARRCVYYGDDDIEPNSVRPDTSQSRLPAEVKLYDNIGSGSKSIQVCMTKETQPEEIDDDLEQPCFLRDFNGGYPIANQIFQCTTTNGAIGCDTSDEEIENPHPERVCYHHGSSCAMAGEIDKVSEKARYGVYKWDLPVGVMIQFYKRPSHGGDEWPFGRNPAFLRAGEKLYNLDQFMNRDAAETLRERTYIQAQNSLKAHTKQEATRETSGDVTQLRRRLLAVNGTYEDVERPGRKLLNAYLVDQPNYQSGTIPFEARVSYLQGKMRENFPDKKYYRLGNDGLPEYRSGLSQSYTSVIFGITPDPFIALWATESKGPDHTLIKSLLQSYEWDFCGFGWVKLLDVYHHLRYEETEHPYLPEWSHVGSPLLPGDEKILFSDRGWVSNINADWDNDGAQVCVQCRSNEVEIPKLWKFHHLGDHEVAGCKSCPGNMIAQPWRSCPEESYLTPQKKGTGVIGLPRILQCCKCPSGLTYNEANHALYYIPLTDGSTYGDSPGQTKQICEDLSATPAPASPRYGFKYDSFSIEYQTFSLPPHMNWELTPSDDNVNADFSYRQGFTMLKTYVSPDPPKYPSWYNCKGAIANESDYPFKTLTEYADSLNYYVGEFKSWLYDFKGIELEPDDHIQLRHKLEYIAYQVYPSTIEEAFDELWFEYESPVERMGSLQGSAGGSHTVTEFPGNYWSYSLELAEGFQCGSASCGDQKATRIHENYYYCQTCRKEAPFKKYCIGLHDCRININDLLEEYKDVPSWQQKRIEILQSKQADGYDFGASVQLALHYAMLQYRSGLSQEGLRKEIHSDFLTTRLSYKIENPSTWTEVAASPATAILWEKQTGEYDEVTGEMRIEACFKEGGAINHITYGACTNDFKINELKDIVNELYNKTGVPLVPPGYSMVLPLSAIQLRTAHTLFSWSNARRDKRATFVSHLLDSNYHCSQRTVLDSVCQVSGGVLKPFNPWLAGHVSLEEGGCDIKPKSLPEVLSTRCENLFECPPGALDGEFYRYQNDGCRELDGAMARRGSIPRGLCALEPLEKKAECEHKQGILGGGDGERHEVLYESADAREFEGFEPGGLFTRPRRLFFSQRSFLESVGISKRAFYVKESDIGAHYVFSLKDETMKLVDVILSGRATGVEDRENEAREMKRFTEATHSLSWLDWDVVDDDRAARLREPDLPNENLHWACPLKMRIYLSGANSNFRPSIPNARRAEIMFATHNERYRSSTVQRQGDNALQFESKINTHNGVCFCSNNNDCQFSIADESPCSFLETVGALKKATWLSSKSITSSPCKKQVDWPTTGGTMRDGSVINGVGYETVNCSLIDRLHEFQYRYKTVSAASNEDVRRNIQSGDCHMEKAHGTVDTVWDYGGVQSCSSCDSRPSFTVNGIPIQSETSFGVPYRISSSRVLAEEMKYKFRLALCGTNSECGSYSQLLNVSSYVPDHFWQAFWTESETLLRADVSFDRQETLSVNQKLKSAEGNSTEDALWDKPWVFCEKQIPNCQERCTTEGNCVTVCDKNRTVGTCDGNISRETWLDPKSRKPACKSQIAGTDLQGAFEMSLCDLSSVTDEFCKAIHQAKTRVFEINCKVSGVCTSNEFFYTPSIFSVSNAEYVRDTVESFYLRADENSCPQRDVELERQQQSNVDLLYKCPATALQTVYDLLDSIRSIIEKCIRILYYTNLMFLNMLRLIFLNTSTTATEAAKSEVSKYFELVVSEAADLLKEFADLVFDMIMNDGVIGPIFKGIFDVMCYIVSWIQTYIMKTIGCLVAELLYGAMLGINTVCFDCLGSTLPFFLEMKEAICDPRVFNCTDLLDLDRPVPNITSLPVATRCYSDYVSRFGEGESSLTCSAADTCYLKDLQTFDEAAVDGSETPGVTMCDACPTPEVNTEARYACDLFTKSCKCGVSILRKSMCINNHECNLDGYTCQIMDNLLNADPYGVLNCNQCSGKKICLLDATSDRRVGYCGCSLQHFSPFSCERNDIGETSLTPFGTMCYAAIGDNVRQTIDTQSAAVLSSDALAFSRCDLLDPNSRRCSTVEFAPGTSSTYVVGSPIGSRNRRLLSDETVLLSAYALSEHALHEAELRGGWEDVQSEMCQFVPLLRKENASLSLSDRYALRHCVRWRAIAREVLVHMDLQKNIPDTFLLGLSDFANDILNHPSRIALVVSKPQLFLHSFLHSEFMTPVRSFLRSARQLLVHLSIEYQGAKNHVDTLNISLDGVSRKEILDTLRTVGLSRKLLSHFMSEVVWRQFAGINMTLSRYASTQNATTVQHFQDRMRSIHTPPVLGANHHRKLLQLSVSDFEARLVDVSKYSVDIALGNGEKQILENVAAEAFKKGPISWPSQFKYWEQESACQLLTNFAGVITESSSLAARSMQNISDTKINVSFSVVDALGTILAVPAKQASNIERLMQAKSKLPWYLQTIVGLGEQLGMDFGSFARWLSDGPMVLLNLVSCDVEAVVLCQKHQYSIVTSAIVALIMLSCAGTLSSVVGFPTLPLLFSVISFGAIVSYLSFSYSPFCFPLIPQCAAASFIQDMERMLPTRFEVPSVLLTCDLDQTITPSAKCIAECDEEPFMFKDWSDNVIFTMCQSSSSLCGVFEEWLDRDHKTIESWLGATFLEGLKESVFRYKLVLLGENSLVAATAWCNVVTFYKVLPLAMLVTVGLALIPIALGVLLRIVGIWLRLLLAQYQMTHVDL